jgi:hypothetical protein
MHVRKIATTGTRKYQPFRRQNGRRRVVVSLHRGQLLSTSIGIIEPVLLNQSQLTTAIQVREIATAATGKNQTAERTPPSGSRSAPGSVTGYTCRNYTARLARSKPSHTRDARKGNCDSGDQQIPTILTPEWMAPCGSRSAPGSCGTAYPPNKANSSRCGSAIALTRYYGPEPSCEPVS